MPRYRAAAALLALVALPAPAAAGTAYFGIGMGPGARLEGEYATRFRSDGHVAGRVIGGYRFGAWAVEASFFGTDLHRPGDDANYSTTAFGLGARYHLTLGHGVDLYVRAGLDRTSLQVPPMGDGRPGQYHDFGGTGLNYGTGLGWMSQPLGSSRVRPRIGAFVDLGVHRVSITRPDAQVEIDGSMEMITLGGVVAFDL